MLVAVAGTGTGGTNISLIASLCSIPLRLARRSGYPCGAGFGARLVGSFVTYTRTLTICSVMLARDTKKVKRNDPFQAIGLTSFFFLELSQDGTFSEHLLEIIHQGGFCTLKTLFI
jgi:hypothetical protein